MGKGGWGGGGGDGGGGAVILIVIRCCYMSQCHIRGSFKNLGNFIKVV